MMVTKEEGKKETVYTYMVETKTGGIYTGITNNPKRRMKEHATGKGAHYTKKHGVRKVLGMKKEPSRSEAMKSEKKIKDNLSPKQKRALATSWKKGTSRQGKRAGSKRTATKRTTSKASARRTTAGRSSYRRRR